MEAHWFKFVDSNFLVAGRSAIVPEMLFSEEPNQPNNFQELVQYKGQLGELCGIKGIERKIACKRFADVFSIAKNR